MNFPGYMSESQIQKMHKRQVERQRQQRLADERANIERSLRLLQNALPKLYRNAKKSAIPVEFERPNRLYKQTVVGGWIIGERFYEYSDSAPGMETHQVAALTENGLILSGHLVRRGELQILVIHRRQRRRLPINGLRRFRSVEQSILGGADSTAGYVMNRPDELDAKLSSYLTRKKQTRR